MLIRWMILFSLATWSTSAEETTPACPELLLPELPHFYSASLLYNVGTRRMKAGSRSKGSSEGPEMGKSYTVHEMIDDRSKKSSVEFRTEFPKPPPPGPPPGPSTKMDDLMTYKIIWNEAIDGVRNFINIIEMDGLHCFADTVADSSILDWLFGFDPNNPNGQLPSVSNMLHFGTNYTSGCPTVVRGIPVNTWKGHWDIAAWKASLEITYYWSDVELWESSSGTGRPVPVRAEIRGITNPGNDTEPEYIDETIEFQEFFEIEPGAYEFQPPADMYCEGREMLRDLPTLPNHYSFGSEVVYTWQLNEQAPPLHVVMPRNEWYDYPMKVSRADSKPLNFENPANPFSGNRGLVSDIQDFTTKLSYVINQDYGNCSVRLLEEDNSNSGDVVIDPSGLMHMADPMHMFHMDQKFAFNGVYMDRGMLMDSYVASYPMSPDNPEAGNFTTVVWLANSMYTIEDGNSTNDRLLPVKILRYPQLYYNDPKLRVVYNIYHFRKTEPSMQAFDITSCFEEYHKKHLTISMAWDPAMDLHGAIYQFNTRARNTIRKAAQITPIRIQNLEVQIFESSQTFNLTFTIVDYPPGMDEGLNVPINALRNISEAKNNLQTVIDKGEFVIKVNINDGQGGRIDSTALPGGMSELDSRGNGLPDGTNVTYKAGYTSGDMAGLAFGMILGGLLLAGVIYFFAMRNSVRAGIPVIRGFDNPLSGLYNKFGNDSSA